jgi:hypothetical protein
MAQEQRDYYPHGVKSMTGIVGSWLRILGTNYVSPTADMDIIIPANPARKWLHISSSNGVLGTLYTGRWTLGFMNEATFNYIHPALESGDSVLINEFTFPWAGTVRVHTDSSGVTGDICVIEGVVE